MIGTVDGREFRRILGHYPTGVCAVTAADESGPAGMIVGSFTSVSLDPPLVAFLPDRGSSTWKRIASVRQFCVNVLSQDQQAVCKALSSKAADKFESVAYRPSDFGLPILDGVVAWVDCELHATHEAGDHDIAIGRVRALDVEHPGPPLVFVRGAYGSVYPWTFDLGRQVSAG